MYTDKLTNYQRLIKGDKVKCSVCGKGYYKPLYNFDVKTATQFTCEKCGNMLIACKKLEIKKENTFYIDDRPADIRIKEYEQKNGELKPLTDAEKEEYGIDAS